MDRSETTKFLRNLLIRDRFSRMGKYWASEVSVDYGSTYVKRVDFMQFEPAGVVYQSDIEKGMFTCFEIKSCKEDVYSGNGLNFLGEKNYVVTTMECYKSIKTDIANGRLSEHIKSCCPESSLYYGVMVAVPYMSDIGDEYENPTPLSDDTKWELRVIYPCHKGGRKRSTTELLFCMLRSGKE